MLKRKFSIGFLITCLLLINFKITETGSTEVQTGTKISSYSSEIISSTCDANESAHYCQNGGVCFLEDPSADYFDDRCRENFTFSSDKCHSRPSDVNRNWCEARDRCFHIHPLAEVLYLNSNSDYDKIQTLIENKILNETGTYWISFRSMINGSSIACNESMCPVLRIQDNNTFSFEEDQCNQTHGFICQMPPQDEHSNHMCLCRSPYSGITCSNRHENEKQNVSMEAPGRFSCPPSQVLMLEFAAFFRNVSNKAECAQKKALFPSITPSCQGISKCNFNSTLIDCFNYMSLRFGCYWGTQLFCPLLNSELIQSENSIRCFFVIIHKLPWEEAKAKCESLGGELAPVSVLDDPLVKNTLDQLLGSKAGDEEYFWFMNGDKVSVVLWRKDPEIPTVDVLHPVGEHKGVCSLPPEVLLRLDEDESTTSCVTRPSSELHSSPNSLSSEPTTEYIDNSTLSSEASTTVAADDFISDTVQSLNMTDVTDDNSAENLTSIVTTEVSTFSTTDSSSLSTISSTDPDGNSVTQSEMNSSTSTSTEFYETTSDLNHKTSIFPNEVNNTILNDVKARCSKISFEDMEIEKNICILRKLANITANIENLFDQNYDVRSTMDYIYPMIQELLPNLRERFIQPVFNYTITIANNFVSDDHLQFWDENDDEKIDLISRLIELVENTGNKAAGAQSAGEPLYHSTENIDIKLFKTNDVVKDVVFGMKEDDSRISVHFPSPVDGVVAVLHLWKTLEIFLPRDMDYNNSTRRLGSVPLGLSVETDAGQSMNVTIIMENIANVDPDNNNCVFLNTSKRGQSFFDDTGCWLVNTSQKSTTCFCNHLTTFAVLTNWNGVDFVDEIALELITLIGCTISIFCLIACLIAIFLIKSSGSLRNMIHGNLCICLLIGNVILLIGLRYPSNLILCYHVAALLHFVFLASFMWMLLEGVNILIMIINVFSNNKRMWSFYLIGYGLPLMIVSLSIGISFAMNISYIDSYDLCWLNRTNYMIWAFLGPVIVIVSANIIILITALHKTHTLKATQQKQKIQKAKQLVWGMIVLAPILGVTWLFGYLFFDIRLKAFAYIFTILNSLQGVFIFLFHFLMNNNMRSLVAESKYFARAKRRLTQAALSSTISMMTTTSSLKSNRDPDDHLNRKPQHR